MMDSLCFDLKEPVYEDMLQDFAQNGPSPVEAVEAVEASAPPPYIEGLPEDTVEFVRNSLVRDGNEEKAETVRD
jgi:hypothetical protein